MALLTKIAARTANRVITISESARDDIVRHFGLDARNVDVTPLGVRNPEASPPRVEGGPPIVLCVGQKRPYKNLASLIHAVAELSDERPTLVLPGAPTKHEAELRRLADRLGVTERVRFLAWVSADELESLYAEATCFVLPSLIEGFGLPLLEAMARGVPVACSDRPALPEVAGDAALLFDPTDQAAVTSAVRRLLNDPHLREELSERGHQRAKEFSWRRTAELTLASYSRAVGD
jgi:glycosyltransferase involved in cell wall biosynthesis